MQQTVAVAVAEYTGVQAQVTVMTAPTTDAVTEADYLEAKRVRDAALLNKSTDFVEKIKLQEDLQKANEYAADLARIIDQQNELIAQQAQTIADRDAEIVALKQQIEDLTNPPAPTP
jgi:predicted  nucleic acid-binding Zn-ribbon protein